MACAGLQSESLPIQLLLMLLLQEWERCMKEKQITRSRCGEKRRAGGELPIWDSLATLRLQELSAYFHMLSLKIPSFES